jgi:magnesium chelatase accessory protein
MPPSHGLTLRGMAESIGHLVEALDAKPFAGVGHSAGAAVLAAMSIDGRAKFAGIVAINGAFLPMRHAGLFGPLARLLVVNPLVPRLFALRGSSASAVDRLIRGTGSTLDARGIELYRRLLGRASHVEGALGMMANWDLGWLGDNLPNLAIPMVLVVADGDKAVPPSSARIVAALAPTAERLRFPRGGHLSHEEYPRLTSDLLLELLDRFRDGRQTASICQPE